MSSVPQALQRQAAMAQSRFPPAREDRSETGSLASWSVASDQDGDLPEVPSDVKVTVPKMATIREGEAASSSGPSAPATQAAKNFVEHTNEPSASKRLRQQQEQAQRRGRKNLRWKQMGGSHNAVNVQLPDHVVRVAQKEGEQSIMILDRRDQRLQSPFQGWLLDEILTNAGSRMNILTDHSLVRPPSQGYHMNLFMLKTLDNMKLALSGCMVSYGSVPCGRWDSETGDVLSHEAFQPFRWPLMIEGSPTWVDVKVKIEGTMVVHLELRGYRSDTDMTVQLNFVGDFLLETLKTNVFIPTFTITVFQGWRVVAVAWEVGGRLYACSEGGVVAALDYPLCHFELRLVELSSADAFGLDADRIEFRFRSAADRLDVACRSCAVPPTWLVVSRVTAPVMVRNANWCRDHYARIEAPDQALQLTQLAGIHAHWTAKLEADDEDEVGPRISAVSVESHASNLHLISESPLFKMEKVIVPKEALALQAHAKEEEHAAVVMPPIAGGPAVQEAAVFTPYKSLMSHGSAEPAQAPEDAEPVAADLSGASASEAWLGGPVMPTRRSLDQRRGESLDSSAMTPAGFVQKVRQVTDPLLKLNKYDPNWRAEEIDLQSGAGQPRSFGPSSPPEIEEL